MQKITGIKSVDFKITARGYGVVNWNGPTMLKNNDGETIMNHSMPKLRGYTNFDGKESEKGYKFKKSPSDIDFQKTPMYISQNCIRHHLFRDHAYDLHYAKNKDPLEVLASITGLIRGYVIPSTQYKRTSPLLLEDFVDQLGNGNFEQMGRSGPKEKEPNKDGDLTSNSFFSKTTFGETKYLAYGSINIEQLQFISLDHKFDRAAMIIKDDESEKVIERIKDFIKELAPDRNPQVVFHKNYVRGGTIFKEGETGILLDNEAIDILVNKTLNILKELNFRQAKGYMYVDELHVDYNDSNKMMRIKRAVTEINEKPRSPYAIYFYPE